MSVVASLSVIVGCTSSSGGTPNAASTASANSVSSSTKPPDELQTAPPVPTSLCGTKPLKIAQVDGIGESAWREIVRAEFADEMAKCSNITVTYAQANDSVQTYNTLISQFVAEGYNAIVTYDDFAQAGLSALRSAYKAGLVVVAYQTDPGGTPGQDYTSYIGEDTSYMGQEWAQWMARVLNGKGDIVYMGGVAGNSESLTKMAAVSQSLKPYPGISWVENQPVTTNWEASGFQQAMAGVITKYPNVDGIVADYGSAAVGGIRAYLAAGKPIPPLATGSADNQLGCLWQQYHKQDPSFQMLWLEGSTNIVLWAGLNALYALAHQPFPYSTVTKRFVFVDTTRGIDPTCNPSLPPDADLSSTLTPAQMKQLFST